MVEVRIVRETDGLEIGDLIMFQNAIIIADREEHLTTQLELEELLQTIVDLLVLEYITKLETVTIYLPRMVTDLFTQAEIQNMFQKISSVSARELSCGSKIQAQNMFREVILVPT